MPDGSGAFPNTDLNDLAVEVGIAQMEDDEIRANIRDVMSGHGPENNPYGMPDCVKCYHPWPCPSWAVGWRILGRPQEWNTLNGMTDNLRAPMEDLERRIGGAHVVARTDDVTWSVSTTALAAPDYPEKDGKWVVIKGTRTGIEAHSYHNSPEEAEQAARRESGCL